MYLYYQKAETDAWNILPIKGEKDPTSLAKSSGAKKITILAVNQMVADGDESEVPRNRDKIAYRGPLYFDIDCKDDLAQAISSGKELIAKLTKMGVPGQFIQVFLSGSKGLHVLVDETLFAGPRFILRLPEIYKEMARELYVVGLDYAVYCGGRGNSFRVPNVQRQDGNYRVPVLAEELEGLTPEKYREMVKAPRLIDYQPPADIVVHELKALYEEARKRVNTQQKVVIIASSSDMEAIKEHTPNCIQMLCDNDGLKSDANFNQAATQLAAYLVRANIDEVARQGLIARLADSMRSSKYANARARLSHIEAQVRYVEHTPSFSFGCNAIRSLLAKRPCEGCPIEHGSSQPGAEDKDLTAEALHDGYYVKVGDGKRRITNFTLQPRDVFIEVPQDGSSPRRIGTRMDVMQAGFPIGFVLFKETSFSSRSAFLREIEGLTDLTFQGTDLDVQRIKIAVYREDEEVSEVMQVYTCGVHIDMVDGTPVFTYVEPDLSINSVKVKGTHQFLGHLQARPYLAHTKMCARADEAADLALENLLKINQKQDLGQMIGWCCACHFKAHIFHKYSQFPVLSLHGNAGSGKSATAGLITWLNGTDFMSQDSGISAPSTSHYAMLDYVSSTTTVPRIIEEYNKSKMTSGAYKDIGERIKQAWNGEAALKGKPGSRTTSRLNAETVAIPVSAPIIVISEQEIEMPAIQERSVAVHMSKTKRANRREFFKAASKGRMELRSIGKALMATALSTTLDQLEELMDRADDLLPENMDDRPRFSQQVVLVGLWKFKALLQELHLFRALKVLDEIIAVTEGRMTGNEGEGYTQSEIDLVMNKLAIIIAISKSSEESGVGPTHLREGNHYVVTDEFLVIDPVLGYAAYTSYCTREERSTPVISTASQFLKLVKEEPYYVKLEPYMGMGGGRDMIWLSLRTLSDKGVDTRLLGLGGRDDNQNFG